jgi:hypothetical protein
MVISPAALGNKNDCVGEGQQKFTQPTDFSSDNFLLFAIYKKFMLQVVKIYDTKLSEEEGVTRNVLYPRF